MYSFASHEIFGIAKFLNKKQISLRAMHRERPLKNVQFCSRPRTIPQDSGIEFAEGEPDRARGMDAPS
jgi:hypothetical protein